MDGQWMTYAEVAERLGVSLEAVRQRAIRNKWARMVGNDKRARIRLPDEPYPTQTPAVRASDQALIDALREHNATLKADVERLEAQLRIEADRLAAAEARSEKLVADFAARDARAAADLAAERAKTEKAIAAAEAWTAREAEKTEKAIAAFSALAERLDALAAERARPWWRRLVG
jgi:DNA primase